MTYAPRVHFRILIWDGLFVFLEAMFCFLVTCSFLYCFQSVVKLCARKGYIILAKCFLMNWYEHSISFFLGKDVYFGILKIAFSRREIVQDDVASQKLTIVGAK
jgi:hypothetical protein